MMDGGVYVAIKAFQQNESIPYHLSVDDAGVVDVAVSKIIN